MSKLHLIKLGDYIKVITDYHANGAYEKLKENVTLLEEPDYAIMIRTLNFEQNDFKDNLLYIDQHAYEYLQKSKVFPNDILMNKIANPGSVYIMPDLNYHVSCGMNLFLIRFNNNVNQRYMYYNMKSNEKYIKNFSHGTTTKTITKDDVRNIELFVHEISEQNKIAKLLTDIDRKIENNNKIIDELEELLRSVYQYWFLQFEFPNDEGKAYKSSGGKMIYNQEYGIDIPASWNVKQLKSLIRISKGISYTSSDIEKGTGIPMINLASVDINRNYKPNELKYFNGLCNKEKIVHMGDMLIACTDLTRNAHIVGSPILVPDLDEEYLFSMDLAKIESITEELDNMYLYMSLRTNFYHDYIKRFASGTNVLHLDVDGINLYSIIVPERKIQKKFNKIVMNVHKKKCTAMKENRKLLELKELLIPLLMNGQIGFNGSIS